MRVACWVALVAGLQVAAGWAQAPLLSPQAAYDRATAPVEIIHRSVENWSEVEKSSLEAAVLEASVACVARRAEIYAGDDLIVYAKLCALGKEWDVVYTAATTYINSKDAEKPQVATAYGYEIQADLNMKREKDAVGTAVAMLRAVPYGPLTDEVIATTVRYLQFAYTRDALSVMAVRQPILLKMLATPAPPVPLHTLFEHALDFPALEQYDDERNVAEILHGDVERAVPAELPKDEAILIAGMRRRYALLGTHFPAIAGAVTLMSATETPKKQPAYGSATVFLLFPPWCAQCVRQAQQMVGALVRTAVLKGPDYKAASLYALLADDAAIVPPVKPAAVRAGAKLKSVETPEPPKTVVEQLRKTPTLVVPAKVLEDFDATDYPFLIATDREGIIRLMVPAAPENALVQGGVVDQITETIMVRWPAKEAR